MLKKTLTGLQLEDGKGTINHISEYVYLGVRITKDRNHKPKINDRINTGQATISKLNSILWDHDVTSKTKTHIYHAIVKSIITYAAETWCLKAQTTAKLNSTEMDFWRCSVRISRKDKIRNIIIKQKMNVTRSLLDDINTLAASYLNTQWLNNSCLKSPASTLIDLTFQSRALRSFSLNQLCNLSL